MSNGDAKIQITATCGEEITYRQWLAGMALQGYRANPRFGDFHESDVAKQCWRDADALLSAQEGQGNG